MSTGLDETDEMLLREFRSASFNNRRSEVERLKCRAIDKALAEFKLLGFCGFIVREVDGELHVDGITANDMHAIPEHLRAPELNEGDLSE